MKSLVVTGLTVTCLFLGAADVFAQYYDEAPGATAKAPGASEAKPDAGKSKPRRSSRRRSRSAAADDYEDSGRRVWTETGSARIKTVYDDQGNVVYQKAWDKRTGKEIPVPEAGRDPVDEDTSRAQRVHESSDRRPYGRLRRDEDGEYEERRADPRPKARNHHLHSYPQKPRKHPYEFSLAIWNWFAVLDGEITGTGGTEGDLRASDKSAIGVDFHNPRVGYSYVRIENSTRVDGAFVFDGVAYDGNLVPTFYDEQLSYLDGFYRWNCYDSRDHWLDFLLGAKVLFVEATVRNALSTNDIDTIVPLPQLGLIGAYTLLDNIKFRGFVKGAFGAISDSSATVIDTELEVVYTFPGDNEYSFLNQFSAGYKYMLIDFTLNQDAADEAGGSLSHDGAFVRFQALF
jgi:hypothetical protein